MKSTAKTVSVVMVIMLLSRVLSLFSVIIYTTFFGTESTEINIYSYAIQFPNIVFTVFGTALSTVVIPIFASSLESQNKDRAYRFANNVISLTTFFTLLLVIAGILLAPLLPLMTRFKSDGYDFAVTALRIMFPIMIFYGLNYIMQGILQSLGKFNMPAFVSIPSSLIVIGYVLLFADRFGVRGLLIATFIGLSTQALILIPPLFKTDYKFRPSFGYRDEDVKKAVRLMIPIMIGTAAYPLNMLFNVTIVANFKNMVTILTLVQNLVSYAVLAFIYSVTAVVFPKFTALAARGDMGEFKDSIVRVLTSVIYFLLPATTGFIVVRKELLNLLVGWGEITTGDVDLASILLAFYAIGITGMGIKEVIDRAFYSLKDTKRPAVIGIIVMTVNIAASLMLLRMIGVYGIPLGNSISTLTGALVLVFLMRRKIGAFGGRKLMKSALKIISACLIMAVVVVVIIPIAGRLALGSVLIDRTVKLVIPALLGAFVYFSSTYFLKVDEAVNVINKVKLRLGLG